MTNTNPTHTNVNAEGAVVKTVQVASDGEQIGAAGIGLITAGPLGALAAWGAIRMFAGKWTPWMLTGVISAPILVFFQLVLLGMVGAMLPTPVEEEPSSMDQSRIELIAPQRIS